MPPMPALAVLMFLVAGMPAAEPVSPAKHLAELMVAGKGAVVVCYGTSLTAASTWPKIVADRISAVHGDRVTLVNAAMSGQNSSWGLKALDERVLARKPDIVFIEFSMNDAVERFAISPKQSRANTIELIERIAAGAPGTVICLMTMNPAHGESGAKRPHLDDYYDIYRAIARERGLPLIDNRAAWGRLMEADPGAPVRMIGDGVHPGNEASVRLTAPAVLAALGVDAK